MKTLPIKIKNRIDIYEWMCKNIGPSGYRWWIDEGIYLHDSEGRYGENIIRLYLDLLPEEEDQVTMIAMMWAE